MTADAAAGLVGAQGKRSRRRSVTVSTATSPSAWSIPAGSRGRTRPPAPARWSRRSPRRSPRGRSSHLCSSSYWSRGLRLGSRWPIRTTSPPCLTAPTGASAAAGAAARSTPRARTPTQPASTSSAPRSSSCSTAGRSVSAAHSASCAHRVAGRALRADRRQDRESGRGTCWGADSGIRPCGALSLVCAAAAAAEAGVGAGEGVDAVVVAAVWEGAQFVEQCVGVACADDPDQTVLGGCGDRVSADVLRAGRSFGVAAVAAEKLTLCSGRSRLSRRRRLLLRSRS